MCKKNILIIGATGGIGADISREMSMAGENLILVSRKKEKLVDLCESLDSDAMVFPCDIRDYHQVAGLFDYLKNEGIVLDAMVYCAGMCYIKPVRSMGAGELEEMFKTNLYGFYEACRLFQVRGASRKGSSIVALSSYAAIAKEIGMSAYAMTKTAMNVAVEVLSKEFLKKQIRINAILPAETTSKMGQYSSGLSVAEMEYIRSYQPLGPVNVEEISKLTRYLVSESSAHITGALIELSGGFKGKANAREV